MISGVVRTALTGLVNGRCWPNAFEQDDRVPKWPAIRFQIINSSGTPDICGTADRSLDDVRVQIDIVAKTFGAAEVLTDQVIAALMNTDPPCKREEGSGFHTKDTETKTHRVVLEYVFYQSNALTGSPATVGSPP